MPPYPTLSYNQVHRKWCLTELLRFLKRWAVYIVMGLLLLGSGASAGISGMAGLLAWAVAPLFHAASLPLGMAMLVTLGHSLLGGMVIVALRPLLWPRAWGDAERALPLSRATRRRSDVHITLIALSPIAAVYGAGAATWLASGAAWLAPVWVLALCMVAASLTGSVVWGLLILHLWRKPSPNTTHSGAVHAHAVSTRSLFSIQSTPHTMWLMTALPLWRGPAQRVARISVASPALGLLCSAAMLRWPSMIGWTLAAHAALAFATTTRLCLLINTDLAPLHDACTPLPIAPARLLRTRQALGMAPPLLALLLIAATGSGMRERLYLAPLLGYLLTSGISCSLVVVKSLARRGSKSQDEVALWLLMLVIVVAFASEVGK